MQRRDDKIANTLLKLSADFLEKNSNRTSLITVTNIIVRDRRREAIVFISVLPEDQEKAALDFANRQKKELRLFIRSRVKMGYVPKIFFEIDKGEKNRQRIDFLSQND